MDATKLFILDFGDDTVSASRFFTHPEHRNRTVEEDRLEGAVTQEQTKNQDMEGMPEDFIEQIARLKAKGYVEIREVLHCRVTRGITEELR